MCLNKLTTAKPLVAQEEIIVYKFLKIKLRFDLKQITNGDEFTGVIKGIECEGRITVVDDMIFFCTNLDELDGFYVEEKHGFNYSWAMDSDVTKVILKKSGDLLAGKVYVTPYQLTEVEIGKCYVAQLEIHDDDGTPTIEQGLHSFQELDSVLKTMEKKQIAVKCIIPKGAKYFIGEYCHYVSYASDALAYVEIVRHEE